MCNKLQSVELLGLHYGSLSSVPYQGINLDHLNLSTYTNFNDGVLDGTIFHRTLRTGSLRSLAVTGFTSLRNLSPDALPNLKRLAVTNCSLLFVHTLLYHSSATLVTLVIAQCDQPHLLQELHALHISLPHLKNFTILPMIVHGLFDVVLWQNHLSRFIIERLPSLTTLELHLSLDVLEHLFGKDVTQPTLANCVLPSTVKLVRIIRTLSLKELVVVATQRLSARKMMELAQEMAQDVRKRLDLFKQNYTVDGVEYYLRGFE